MKKIVVLTGAGMSVESGLSTFRDADGLWENHPVSRVATHEAWEEDPVYVNNFYNMLRKKLVEAKPNKGHQLVAKLEEQYEVVVVTQNVDNLHEMAGSSKVIHLHGELMKVCSSRDVDDPRYIKELKAPALEVHPGDKAGDGSLLRPYIVSTADIFIIIGTSLVVYPAAGLVRYVRSNVPVYLIDPKEVNAGGIPMLKQIQKGASAGMEELINILMK